MQDYDLSAYGEHIAEVYDAWFAGPDTDAAVECLAALAGKAGAKSVIVKHSQDAAGVAFAQGALDIDTIGDVARMEGAMTVNEPPVA